MITHRSSKCSWGLAIVVSKFVLLSIATGIVKSFDVLITTMAQRLQLDNVTIRFLCSLPATLMYACSPISVLLLYNFNTRSVAMSGGLVAASCVLAVAFTENRIAAGVCLVFLGMGLSMLYMTTTLSINEFFPKDFVLMNIFANYGFFIGSILLPIVTERALQAYGYTGALIILGGITLNLVVCGATIRKAPSQIDQEQNEEPDEQTLSLLESDTSEPEAEALSFEEENSITRPEERCAIQQNGLISDLQRKKSRHKHTRGSSRTSSLLHTGTPSCGLLNEPLFLFSLPIYFLLFYITSSWMVILVPNAEQLMFIAPSAAVFLSTLGAIGGFIGQSFLCILIRKGFNEFVIYIYVGILCTASFLLDFTSSAYMVRAVMAFSQGFCIFIEDIAVVSLFKEAVFDERNFSMAVAIGSFASGLGTICAGAFSGYLFDVTQSFTKIFIINGIVHAFMVGHLITVAILIKKRATWGNFDRIGMRIKRIKYRDFAP